jgi:hypothetical protein
MRFRNHADLPHFFSWTPRPRFLDAPLFSISFLASVVYDLLSLFWLVGQPARTTVPRLKGHRHERQ